MSNSNKSPKRIAHVIWQLHKGGAEISLLNLVSTMDRERFTNDVVVMKQNSPIGKQIEAVGVPVHAMDSSGGVKTMKALAGAVKTLSGLKPDLVQTWMYLSDMVGSVSMKLSGCGAPVVWNIRDSNVASHGSGLSTRIPLKICSRMSHSGSWGPARIIANSYAGMKEYERIGYNTEKMVMIPNGFNVEEYGPAPEARVSFRQELGLGEDAILIGLVKRYSPMKGHEDFVKAAAILTREMTNVHFVMCGRGVDENNSDLMGWIQQEGMQGRCHALGERDDIPRVQAALDIATSASWCGEGFPRSIGEALASGTPCVATDDGDTRVILENGGGVLVTPRKPGEMAAAWAQLIKQGPEKMTEVGQSGRKIIIDNYKVQAITDRYEKLYEEVIAEKR